MSADPEGDSEMLSSSSETSDTSNPQTPTGGVRTTGQPSDAASELSPPGSQDATGVEAATANYGEGERESAPLSYGTYGGDGQTGDKQSDLEALGPPGSSYRTTKAEEEYQRAMEMVVDRDFSLAQFGDPFDERDMGERAQ